MPSSCPYCLVIYNVLLDTIASHTLSMVRLLEMQLMKHMSDPEALEKSEISISRKLPGTNAGIGPWATVAKGSGLVEEPVSGHSQV